MGLLHREKHADADTTADDRTPDRTDGYGIDHTKDHATERTAGGTAVAAAPVVHDGRDDHPLRRRDDDPDRTTTVRERTWTFAPGQVVSFAAGIAVAAVGVIALLRAGIGEPLASPTVDVLGFSHTAWLGLAEIGLGLLLILAGTGAWGRPLSVLLGAAAVIAGTLVLAEPGQMPEELALEKDFGWPLLVLGAVVALAAMALPVWRRRTITDDEIVDLREQRRFQEQAPRTTSTT
jgi:hypothetical protein